MNGTIRRVAARPDVRATVVLLGIIGAAGVATEIVGNLGGALVAGVGGVLLGQVTGFANEVGQ